MTQMQHHQPTSDMQQCVTNCLGCHQLCEQTAQHCLQMGGKHASADHIRLLRDCAQICQTSADFMLRGSSFHHRTCGVCAEVCEQCAQDCSALAEGDEQMLACADACRRCAESCRSMAAMAA